MFFSRVLIDGEETIEWHDAIRCRDKYKDRIDRKQDGIDDEFRSDYWICPDIDEIALQNNPATYQTGNGQNFNLMITSCGEAKRLEEEKGKKSYNSNYDNCQDVNTEKSRSIIANMVFKSKIMSQEGGTPKEFKDSDERTTTYFTFRTTTDALTTFGLTYRASAIREKINYFSDYYWLDKLPYVHPIEKLIGESEP